jgi:hypothetical protein
MASAAAIIGLLIARGFAIQTSALIFLAVFMVTGAGNAVNDYYDREIDAVNSAAYSKRAHQPRSSAQLFCRPFRRRVHRCRFRELALLCPGSRQLHAAFLLCTKPEGYAVGR